jgi:ferredoxin
MTQRLKVTVDTSLCVSNHMCIHAAPGVFQVDPDGTTVVIDPNGDAAEAVIDAGLNCPAGAIGVFDADTGADLLD